MDTMPDPAGRGEAHGDVRGDAADVPDAELARRAVDGEREAFGLLFGRWFDRAFDVAWYIHHDREAAADSVADAFAAAWRQIGDLRQPGSFGGWLLRITRNRALNRLQKDRRTRPVREEDVLVSLDTRTSDDPGDDLGRGEQQELVWAASEALGEEDASLLNLHLRHQLEPAELAEELGVEPNAAHQRLHRLRHRLGDAVGAWLLWHRGAPLCTDLSASVAGLSEQGFNRVTARAVLRHAKGCDECTERRSAQTRPEVLFSLAPLAMADPSVRAQVVAALGDIDVPTAGSGTGAGTGETSQAAPADEAAHRAGRATHARDLAREHPRLVGAGAVVLVVAVGLLAFLTITRGPPGSEEAETVVAGGAVPTGPTEPGSASVQIESREGDEGLPAKEDAVDPAAAPGPGDGPDDAAPAAPPDDRSSSGTGALGAPPTTGVPPGGPPPREPPPEVPPDDRPAERVPIGDLTTDAAGICSATQWQVTFTWTSTDATSAVLGPSGGIASAVPVDGSAERCVEQGTTWVLTVSGPGGQDTARYTAPPVPRPG
jgi:RNA polymerase sigma factor (sigma-70 family)